MPLNPAGTAPSVFTGSLFYILVFVSLWDIYVAALGVRPLDLLAVSIALSVTFLRILAGDTLISRTAFLACGLLTALLFYSVSAGLLLHLDSAKLVLGILLGFILFVCLVCSKIDVETVGRILTVLLVAHVVAFILQLAIVRSTGVLISPLSYFGLEVRAFSQIIRPTGLFLEPGSYSCTIAMLIVLRYLAYRSFDLLSFAACISMILSISLWGIGIGFALIVGAVVLRPIKTLYTAVIATIPAASIGVLFLSPNDLAGSLEMNWLIERLLVIQYDNSAYDRYFSAESGLESRSFLTLMFGHGISYDYLDLGYNGLSFIVSAIGILGSATFLMGLLLISRFQQAHITLPALAITLTAAPLWNMMIWWVWLALLFGLAAAKLRPA